MQQATSSAWMKTLTILLHDDGNSNKILIFGMQENLLKFSELNTIYMYVDGTFSTCPSYFTSSSQLMALLTVSSSLRYTDFSLLKVKQIRTDSSPPWRKMQNSGLTLQPSAVMADFDSH